MSSNQKANQKSQLDGKMSILLSNAKEILNDNKFTLGMCPCKLCMNTLQPINNYETFVNNLQTEFMYNSMKTSDAFIHMAAKAEVVDNIQYHERFFGKEIYQNVYKFHIRHTTDMFYGFWTPHIPKRVQIFIECSNKFSDKNSLDIPLVVMSKRCILELDKNTILKNMKSDFFLFRHPIPLFLIKCFGQRIEIIIEFDDVKYPKLPIVIKSSFLSPCARKILASGNYEKCVVPLTKEKDENYVAFILTTPKFISRKYIKIDKGFNSTNLMLFAPKMMDWALEVANCIKHKESEISNKTKLLKNIKIIKDKFAKSP